MKNELNQGHTLTVYCTCRRICQDCIDVTKCQINYGQDADKSMLSQRQDCEQLVPHMLCTDGEQNIGLMSKGTDMLSHIPIFWCPWHPRCHLDPPGGVAAPAWAPTPTGPVWGPCPATPSATLLLLGLLVPSKLCCNVRGQVVKPLFDRVPAVLHTPHMGYDLCCYISISSFCAASRATCQFRQHQPCYAEAVAMWVAISQVMQ